MVDIHQPGDYRIILGDSLKDGETNSISHVGVKYNWLPSGLEGSKGTIRGSDDNVSLTFENDGGKYRYSGWRADRSEQNVELALFYNQDQSVFVLEKIDPSIEVNIKSGTEVTSDQIRRHALISRAQTGSLENSNHNNRNEASDDDDDGYGIPDESNPFDYRHFLEEAKEAHEKTSHHAGGGTPLGGGGRTPMSGLSSPMPGASSRFHATTPQFEPTKIVSSNHNLEKGQGSRKKVISKPAKTKPTRKTNVFAKSSSSRPKTQPPALSSERVEDSDLDEDGSADMSDRPSPRPAATKSTSSQAHVRKHSVASTDNKEDEDDDNNGDLEIEGDSPQQSNRPKRGYRVDPGAFRTNTSTPVAGDRAFGRSIRDQRPVSRDSNIDVDVVAEAETNDEEENEDMKYFQDDDDDDDDDRDGDVDELVLDEAPRSPTPPPLAPVARASKLNRRQSSTVKRYRPRSPSPPSHHYHESTMDDDDGGLAAELEAALEQEMEAEDETGVGLGIGLVSSGGSGGGGQEDESDISEEE